MPADHGVAAVDPARKQGHAFVARRRAAERRHAERSEIRCLDQLGPYGPAAIGRVGRIEDLPFAILEFHEAGIFDSVRLGIGDRKDDAFAYVLVEREDHLDVVAIGPAMIRLADLGNRCKPRRRIDGDIPSAQ